MRRLLLAPLLAAVLAASAAAETSAPGYRSAPLFEMPKIAAAERQAARLAAAGDPSAAHALLDALKRRFPQAAQLYAETAILFAAAGEDDKALEDLTKAVSLGLPDFEALTARPPLNRLTRDPRFETLATTAPRPAAPPPPPPPTRVDNGDALVSAANTAWDPEKARLLVGFEMLDAMRRVPIADGKTPPAPIARLQTLAARGKAAGNVGDLYDNRDDGHSQLSRRTNRTQMSHVVYSPEARTAGLHYGLNTQLLFDAIVIGNSSTALTGAFWRSQPRAALTSPDGAAQLAQLYDANHIYVFPEHLDHDPRTPTEEEAAKGAKPGHGDLFPANTPYLLISQGSSGSDRPILEALRAILAAFPPDVKQALKERNLVAPTVQQIFRRSQSGILTDEDYLSPRAHPVVFDGARIDLARAIDLANELRADEIPPVARIRVDSEESEGALPGPIGGEDIGEERLFDTPSAAARVWRGAGYTRRYILDASATKDPNGRPLRFHWLVTQGRAKNATVRPLDEAGARAEVTLVWDTPAPEALRPEISSPRVDIAVIADNGAALSAPAFFSMLYPAHQERVYEGDEAPRLTKIDHTAGAQARLYIDPLIWPRRTWSDSLRYDDRGRLLGWTRTRWKKDTRFTAQGLLIRKEDEAGRPALAEAVEYALERDKNGAPVIAEKPTGRMFAYRYSGPDDRIGAPEEVQ